MNTHEYLVEMKLAEHWRDISVAIGIALRSDFLKRKAEFEYKKKVVEIEKEYSQSIEGRQNGF